MADPVPFDDMRSAVPADAPWRTAGRVDPYWHGMFAGGAQASWVSRSVAERRDRDGVEPLLKRDKRWDVDKAVAALTTWRVAHDRLAGLASLCLWRTCTVEQLAALTGRGWSDREWDASTVLFAAQVADRGRPVPTLRRTSGLPELLRISPGRHFDRLLDQLDYDTWVAVTASYPPTRGPQHDRHNVVTTELALRVAEFCEVGTVLGEALCGHHFFDPRMEPTTDTFAGAADAAIVRTDGLTILVETTAYTSARQMRDKVARWVDIIIATSDDPNFMVLFVEADRITGRRRPNEAWNQMRRGITTALADSPSAAKAGVHSRVAAARWRWWFPDAGVADPGFVTLSATRPTNLAADNPDDRWEPAHLLDPIDIPGPDTPDVPVLRNAQHLWGVPHWLRSRDTDDWTDVVSARTGIPMPEPVDPDVRFAPRTSAG